MRMAAGAPNARHQYVESKECPERKSDGPNPTSMKKPNRPSGPMIACLLIPPRASISMRASQNARWGKKALTPWINARLLAGKAGSRTTQGPVLYPAQSMTQSMRYNQARRWRDRRRSEPRLGAFAPKLCFVSGTRMDCKVYLPSPELVPGRSV